MRLFVRPSVSPSHTGEIIEYSNESARLNLNKITSATWNYIICKAMQRKGNGQTSRTHLISELKVKLFLFCWEIQKPLVYRRKNNKSESLCSDGNTHAVSVSLSLRLFLSLSLSFSVSLSLSLSLFPLPSFNPIKLSIRIKMYILIYSEH